MDTTSYWLDSGERPAFPPLDRDLTVDTLIVGGGVTGISTAWHLKRAGQKVALVERDRCLGVDTGHTTAHLTAVVDERYHVLADRFGDGGARAVWDAGATAIDAIDRAVRERSIDCGFHWVPGYLHALRDDADERAALQRELRKLRELGVEVRPVDSVPLFGTPGLLFPGQALFHPVKYLAALLRDIDGGGSHVFEHSPASGFSSDPRHARVGAHRVRFERVVLATHNPLSGLAGTLGPMIFQTKLALQTSYAVGAKVPRGLLPAASFWDTGDPYGYLRVDHLPAYDYAIYGGADHKTGLPPEPTDRIYSRLAADFLRRVPAAEIDHRWSGQVIATPDGLPYIGETAPGQFVATGFAGNGLTFGTLAALMIVDAIAGQSNPWRKLFAPDRAPFPGGLLEYLRENKDYPYHLLRDRLAPAQADSLNQLAPGRGRIVSHEGRKVAAWRDADGRYTLCSPVCPHLGCIVGWNEAEATWDCPCHGSRFTPEGKVISGPAETSLERLPSP